MDRVAALARQARLDASLSVRELAGLAGIAPSTVTRIEQGSMNPTLDTLARLLAAAGCDLELRTRPAPRLADLADAWDTDTGRERIDWTRLRACIDHLVTHPHLIAQAIQPAPPPSGSGLLDNLLAATADKLADDAGLPRPGWTTQTPPLPDQWVTPGTPRMQAAARAATPPQFAARSIHLPADALWRAALTADA